MGAYLIRRLIRTAIVLWGVSTIVFVVTRLSGDPIQLMVPPDMPPAQVEVVRHQYGLDRPVPLQYVTFLSKAVTGDFGSSIRQRQPAMELALQRIPATLQLAVMSFAFAVLVGVPLGIVAAIRPRTIFDNVTMTIAVVGQALPTFFLGILLILVVAVQLHWLPVGGRSDWRSWIMPTITLGTFAMASIARLTRSAMLETLSQDYVRTGRAKGLAEYGVVMTHAFRNALIPIVTIMGLQFGTLLGGAVVTETIFSWPGLGLLAIYGIRNRDYPIVQAAVFLAACAFVLVNLTVDLLYAQLDPRIRIG